ncbi:MAG: FAD-dependent oxidoreductase, partial [Candidatus Bathyarchaeia archaeon]
CKLTGIASYLKLRETRRIIGEYVLTGEDAVLARKFEDGIARCAIIIDIHHPTNPKEGFIRHIHLREPKEPAVCRPAQCTADTHRICRPGGYEARGRPGDYYEIPYRCLVPLKIDNLIVAGKGISTDFATSLMGYPPHGTGQAAGTAAAICIKDGIIPRKLDGKLVRKTLIEQGVPLDKEPAFLSQIKEKLKGKYVVGPGDSIFILTPKGVIVAV